MIGNREPGDGKALVERFANQDDAHVRGQSITQETHPQPEWLLAELEALVSSTLFEGHIALSPSLGWGGQQTLTGLIARLETPMGTARRLYASVADEPPSYRDTFTRLERALERSKSEWLVHRLRRFDTEDHTTTVAPALYDAMKWMYQPR